MRNYVLLAVTLIALAAGAAGAGASRTYGSQRAAGATEKSTEEADGAASQEEMQTRPMRVTGEQMKAFLAAYRSFSADPEIPREKRKIENYYLLFEEGDGYISITFAPKRKPGAPVRPGGSNELGKAVTYKISKDKYRILKKSFYK